MSDMMLIGVLRMPPECWNEGHPLDRVQRHNRYIEAADRIESEPERIEAAVREAVEAERGRHPRRWRRDELAQAPDGFYTDGDHVYPRDYCAYHTRVNTLFYGPIPTDGNRIAPAAEHEPTTDSEGAGYECRECRHINNTPGFCRNCGFDAYPTL